MRIDFWGDIACPFCFIGKRHLDLALENFEHRDDVDIVLHSFELDPTIPREARGSLAATIAEKFGISVEQSEQSQRDVAARAAEVGLNFNWQAAQYGNTFDAHRLIHLAADHGLALAAQKRLMDAYFSEGAAISDPAELQRIGEEIGLPTETVRAMLAGTDHTDAVRTDESQARELGITGVPFFVLDGKYGLSGAQPVEVLTRALDQAWNEGHANSPSTGA